MRMRTIQAVANKEWGVKNETLRALYIGYIHSVLDYAGSAWQMAISNANLSRLEAEEHRAARYITGCYLTTPTEPLMKEANLLPLHHRRLYLAAKLYEKQARDETNPNANNLAQQHVRKKRDLQEGRHWRKTAHEVISRHGINNHLKQNINLDNKPPPWTSKGNTKVFPELTTNIVKKQKTNEELREITNSTINERGLLNSDIQVWTDGSVEAGQTNGGAGYLITNPAMSINIRKSHPAGALACSYQTELIAIREALNSTYEELENQTAESIAIMTDNRGALQTVNKGPGFQEELIGCQIWDNLGKLEEKGIKNITFQWVPSHTGLEGNDIADELAKEGCKKDQKDVPITFKASTNHIKKTITDNWKKNITFPLDIKKSNNDRNLTRPERVALARLRSGHFENCNYYKHKIGKLENPNCDECRCPETTKHIILSCSKYTTQRLNILGDFTVENLDIDPIATLRFCRETGILPDL